jgi:hypothetical protein
VAVPVDRLVVLVVEEDELLVDLDARRLTVAWTIVIEAFSGRSTSTRWSWPWTAMKTVCDMGLGS